MAKATLRLVGTFDAWAPFARTGRLVRANGSEVAVLVRVLDGTTADETSLATLRDDGRLLARLQHENVLRVEQTSGVGGKLAVVHENFDCVAVDKVLAALHGRGQALPARVAAEIASAVGIALEEALKIGDEDRRIQHPSPTPQEILVDTSGRVKLAGLRVRRAEGEWPAAARGYAAPGLVGNARDGWQAATWMVGALLAELLTGEAPPEVGANANTHEAALRKVVIKILGRPGDQPSELLVQAVKQALAADPDVRGTPGAWGRMLREVSVQLPTPGLRAWAPGTIPAVQRGALAAGRPAAGLAAGLTIAPPQETGRAPPLPPDLASRAAAPVAAAAVDDDPEPTMMGLPTARPPSPAPPLASSPALATESSPPVEAATAAEPQPAPVYTPAANTAAARPANRPAPRVVRPPSAPAAGDGPRVGANIALPVASGPSVAPGAPPPGGPQLLPEVAEDSEFEATVVARPLRRDGPTPASTPSLLDDLRPGAAGPVAPAPRVSALDDDEPAPRRRSLLPLLLLALAAVFIGASVLAGGGALWWFSTDELPAEKLPTLGDVVGAQSAEAPGAATPAEASPAAPAEVTPAAPAAPAAEVAPAGTPPAPASTAPAAVTTPPPVAAASAPAAPAAASPSKSAPAASKSTATTKGATPSGTAAPASSAAAPAAPSSSSSSTAGAPVRIAPRAAEPEPAPVASAPAAPAPAAPAVPAAEAPSSFRVQFSSADPALSLEVKCTQGGGSGAVVVIDEAVKGNCRVTGRSDTGTVMTLVTVSGARSYQCFAAGARTCQ